ncbi:PH domain-containing protein, partial [Salinifilum aidingensis]
MSAPHESSGPHGSSSAGTPAPWWRLDARVLLATAALVLAPLVPTALVMLLGSARASTVALTAAAWIAFAVLATASNAVEWSVTRYRVTSERFELRRGVLTRSHRSIPRDRIRSVDLTANPAQRLLGIAVVSIGTAEQGEQEAQLKLDALARSEAEALRGALLDHLQDAERPADTGVALARMRVRWFGYAALTASLILTVWGAVLSALSSLRDLLVAWGAAEEAERVAGSLPLWLAIGAAVAFGLLLGAAGSLAISVEQWWRFRLSRSSDGTLLVRRGLLTTRAVSLEERRLRGAELTEPVLLRLFRGARLAAVTTGLGGEAGRGGAEKSALLPPAPRSAAERVAAAVLRRPWPAGPLATHPRAALRRRLLRAGVAVVP